MALGEVNVRVAGLIHTAKITLGVTHHVPSGHFVALAGDRIVLAGPAALFDHLPSDTTDLWLGSDARAAFFRRAKAAGVPLAYKDGTPVVLDEEEG